MNAHMILTTARAMTTVHQSVVIKTYYNPADAVAEIKWYQHLDGLDITPECYHVDTDKGELVTRRMRMADEDPTKLDPIKLAYLLHRLETMGIHHRDVHLHNIALDHIGRPRLIDWECACLIKQKRPSYDLYGPRVSDIRPPALHANQEPQWWGSKHDASIANTLKVDLPDDLSDWLEGL